MLRRLPLACAVLAVLVATPAWADNVRATAVASVSATILPGSARVSDGRLSVVAGRAVAERSAPEVYAGPLPRSRACTVVPAATGVAPPPCRLIEYSLL